MRASSAGPSRAWRAASDEAASRAAILITLAILAAGAGALWTYTALRSPRVPRSDPYLTPFFGPDGMNASILRIAAPFDSAGQKLAHLVLVALTAAATVLGLRGLPRLSERAWPWLASLPFVAATALLWHTHGRITIPDLLAGAASLLVVFGLGRPRLRRPLHALFDVTALLLLALAILPAPFWRLDLTATPAQYVPVVEWHYAMVMGPGELLASGYRLFGDVQPAYGAWPAVFKAALHRLFGSLSWGDDVLLLQGVQALYLVLATVLYRGYGRAQGAGLLAGLALVVPLYHFCEPGLLTPNLTPWRLIAMPLGLLAVLARPHAPVGRTAFVLGAVGGTAVLFNLESGAALAAGLVAFLALRFRLVERATGWAVRGRATASFICGALAALGLFFPAVRVLLGQWPDLARLGEMARVAAFMASSGYGGLPLPVNMVAILMMAHAVFVLVRTALARENGLRASFRALVSTTLLVFFAYYAHRPDPASLGPLLLLYGFLLIDLLRGLVAATARRRLTPMVTLGAAALGLVIAPAIRHQTLIAVSAVRQGLQELGRPATLTGVRLSPTRADEVLDRAGFLQGHGGSLFLTSDSYLIPKVARVVPSLPLLDLAAESINRSGYDRFLDQLSRAAPERVFLDAPGTLAHGALFRPLYEQLRRDLGTDYRRRELRKGWEVWSRVSNEDITDAAPAGWDASLRIVAVGGASVEGRGLRAGSTWPERLGRELSARGRVAVLNAGMDGQTVAGHRALLARGLAAVRPQVALLLVGIHDAPLVAEDLRDEDLDLRAQGALELVGMRPARVMEVCRAAWVPAYRRGLDALLAEYRAQGVEPVLVTHPALFGAGKDPATGVDLATVVVHPDARINGALARGVLEAFNDVARDLGRSGAAPLIDLARALPGDSRLFADFVRLNETGSEEAARRIAQELGPWLADRFPPGGGVNGGRATARRPTQAR